MADSDASGDEEQTPLLQSAISTALLPIRTLTSPPFIKAYISTLLFITFSGILVSISVTAYASFYYNYIPSVSVSHPLHLQYSGGSNPYAATYLEPSTLISDQPYDIAVELVLPRTPRNIDAGNFMIDLSLLSPPATSISPSSLINSVPPNISTVISNSRRAAILPYESHLLSIANTAMGLPLHLTGFRDIDCNTLVIPMFEKVSFANGWRNIPGAARVELQSVKGEALQVYSAKLIMLAQFQGLRYILYNYRVISFLIFTAVFYTFSLAATSVAWLVISSLLNTSRSKVKSEERSEKKIKQEEDDQSRYHSNTNGNTIKAPAGSSTEAGAALIKSSDSSDSEAGLSLSNLSDSATQFPTLSRQMPLRFPVAPPGGDGDRASGSGRRGGGGFRRSSQPRAPQPPAEAGPGDSEQLLGSASIDPLATGTEEGVADDESEEDIRRRMDPGTIGTSSDTRGPRFHDSGIGTSMESSGGGVAGLTRRKSSRSMRGNE